jgi:hypothetical protein
MANFRLVGIDFDDLFDVDQNGDGPQAPYLRAPNGQPLRYAHIQYGSKRADVGYRQNGQDVSNLWAAKGTAVYSLPFNGHSFSGHVSARTNQTGTIQADAGIAIYGDGTYRAYGGGTGVTQKVEDGRWLPVGANPADYEVLVQVANVDWGISNVPGTTYTTNPNWQNGSVLNSGSIRVQAPARSSQFNEGNCRVYVYVRRVGQSNYTTSYINCRVSVTGWV